MSAMNIAAMSIKRPLTICMALVLLINCMILYMAKATMAMSSISIGRMLAKMPAAFSISDSSKGFPPAPC